MNIIELYENLKGSYKSYLESFVAIKDERIKEKVSDSIKQEELWSKALIQFNPNFEKGIGVKELIAKGLPIHPDLEQKNSVATSPLTKKRQAINALLHLANPQLDFRAMERNELGTAFRTSSAWQPATLDL